MLPILVSATHLPVVTTPTYPSYPFPAVPQDLLDALGTLELVMQLELDEGRRLARVDAKEIMKGVSQAGYFLQLAPIEPEGKRQLQ